MKQQSFAKENKYFFIECQFVIRIYPNEKKNTVIKNCIDKYYSAFLLSCEFKVHIDKNSSLFNNESNSVARSSITKENEKVNHKIKLLWLYTHRNARNLILFSSYCIEIQFQFQMSKKPRCQNISNENQYERFIC